MKPASVKHTPGPWVIDEVNSTMVAVLVDDVYHYIAECDGNYIHTFTESEMDANARLIAAAPDLLAACKLALTFKVEGCPEPDCLVCKQHAEERAQIEAAITKAEGGL